MLGGAGLVAVNVYASATEGGGDQQGQVATGQVLSAPTVYCPDAGSRLTSVPDGARAAVDGELARMDQQIAAAYQQLTQHAAEIEQDPGFADQAIIGPLKEQRSASLQRIADAIGREGDRPQGLDDLAACTLRSSNQGAGQSATPQGSATPSQSGQGSAAPSQGTGAGGQGGNGPVAADYADITSVQPNVTTPAERPGGSTGTFSSSCGVNANGLFNSDNVIVAPGVSNGAHHFHDYIGNQSNNAFASDQDLANADTSCADQGDKSTYYWPVLRLQNGKQERDADKPGGGTEGNAGQIVTAKEVTLTFEGNPTSKVTEMPRLLRIITGDAKAFVNGPANANASWSCTGYENRQLKDKYPLCPSGSDVVRTFRFQSCWDGRNIDSANHRTHVAFEAPDGSCPAGFQAIPQLVQRIVYDVAAPSLQDGGRTVPLFAVDSFPEQLHKPVTDHGDFINVFDESLMRKMVDCINSGRTCGAGAGEQPPSQSAEPAEPSDTASPVAPPAESQSAEPSGPATGQPSSEPASSEPPADTPATETPTATAPGSGSGGTGLPRVYATASPKKKPTTKSSGGGVISEPTQRPDTEAPTAGDSAAPTGTAVAAPAGQESPATGSGTEPQTEPQAVQGGLAETGAHLWPAVFGGLLLAGGAALLWRTRRNSV
ncbi:MAG: DUF1996 domain-containing protein [Streptomyces sp.]|uniref:DUF1996 domain-containing protein n=1 Tax=Streptomyces sp. TaxID=1931 RepID=UPI0025E186C9|nr:DUF1996 domain-containing protein [Streptomyces sp.]MBW8799173.1 DUF1996 domain-containing protein [Streptomyces sp.]